MILTTTRDTESEPSARDPYREPAVLGADVFRSAFRHHPGGVAFVTADGADGPAALTATSLTSISAEPALLAFSVSHASSASTTIRVAETVVVHLLDASNVQLAKLGATSGIDRFSDTTLWTRLATGEPVFHNTRWLRARVLDRVDVGAATLIVAVPIESNITADEGDDARTRDGLAYVNHTWHRLCETSRLD